MKIVFLTGSYPPDACGVGDYTGQLAEALRRKGVAVEVICRVKWSLGNIGGILRAVRSLRPNIVHIQYPTVGFGKKLTPQLLSLAMPCVITIHEASEAHVLRQLSLYPFSLRSEHVIFTTPYERDHAVRRAPWIARKCSVIPVGSSIRTAELGRPRNAREIVSFGLFRPQKGLEDVFALAELIKAAGAPLSIRLIGKPYPAGSPYFEGLRQRSRDLPITWDIDLGEDAVAERLAGTSIGYMPFPDGASGRRTSLLALLANGVATITTRGAHTPQDMDKAVLFSRGPEETFRMIEELCSDDAFRERLSGKGRAYAAQFSWDAIAQRHVELYERLIR
jgi:glycosyltransferase involved in cell wall biosynthesis